MASDGDLGDLLAKILPFGAELTVRHASSIPSPSPALFAAAPGEEPEQTFLESHFLSASVDSPKDDGAEIIVFGMEVLVYTTAHLTTIFVSKADSTGFIHLLELPQRVSVLRLISSTFLSYLARTHQRPGVRLVVSLFARAQNQYLFPGSIENAEKHVLDDRGLIKWWCRAVDPILREHEPESLSKDPKLLNQTVEATKASATAYLIVPGCDRFETRNFFPATARSDAQDRPRWLSSYPLKQMCHDPEAPPRCLVPRLPDDPKTRFLIDLDDELPESIEGEGAAHATGQWKSIKSLDQFWEMMSFRQECSAGRLVGFLWLVINPPGLMNSTTMASRTRSFIPDKATSQSNNGPDQCKATPVSESHKEPTDKEQPAELHSAPAPSFDRPLVASVPAASMEPNSFYWPEAGRGNMMDCVLDHFYDEKEIVASTKAYVDEVASLADQLTWGKRAIGTHAPQSTSSEFVPMNNLLDSGLIRKRKKSEGEATTAAAGNSAPQSGSDTQQAPSQPTSVNVLNADLIRKKKRT
ncbi:uncharacterized protein N7477_007293 [Penicillium maclennaniae]|uniref:uncharacterized protein n=1 Tax=Penicillium maclennaniae TaxID=1343394 RepID=UPI00254122DC|nr:uncharacterized protein N7477_007293 [Penicillium maclennaniae]KAJ5664845.1 hypothetical protein N7477_007293 [Penicillium maclennaniae]